MILLSIFLLASGPESNIPVSFLEDSEARISAGIQNEEKKPALFHQISEKTLQFGVGAAFGSASLLARIGWGISLASPLFANIGNECLLLGQVCGQSARHILSQMVKGSPFAAFSKKIPMSQDSWYLNQKLLSQIPAFSKDDKELLLFLQKRWLAKSTGFYPFLVDWICPSFGISLQVHPETTNSYARDPWNKPSQTYLNRIESWKNRLPHPQHFPLILTRPYPIQDYLPNPLSVSPNEKIQTTVGKVADKIENTNGKIILDLTDVFTLEDPNEWLKSWLDYQNQFSALCQELGLDQTRVLCIQRVQQPYIGGIRLLPFSQLPAKEIERQHQFLLERISKFGLSANRIELDRWSISENPSHENINRLPPIEVVPDEKFLATLEKTDNHWKTNHIQKTLMFKGATHSLKGLFNTLSKNQLSFLKSPTQSSIVKISLDHIEEQLKALSEEKETDLFFNTASRVEQIHANLTPLLEVYSPFTQKDFPPIYQSLLSSIPSSLQPLTSYALHSSGMASIAGIFKAVETSLGKPPRVLYGENTYFENILYVALPISNASSIEDATEKDWKEVDLILAQFNPALRRIDFQVTEYRVEKIAEMLHQTLSVREGKPLTVAIDCTFDFINSPQVSDLLTEFQEEIHAGILNIICYRSGLKFDLFGLDNYCGAPLYMIHNQNAHWNHFDRLLNDLALQTDHLSFNWFCLAYQNVAPQLELYRKQVFDNTRELLNRVPARLLYDKSANYRIIPIESEALAGFIDFKIFGPLHQVRGALVAGFLSLKCMEKKHPIFYRPSLGFYHPNLSMLFSEECSTIRLTLGLDPTQVDVLVDCFKTIDHLNDSPWSALWEKLIHTSTPSIPSQPAFTQP